MGWTKVDTKLAWANFERREQERLVQYEQTRLIWLSRVGAVVQDLSPHYPAIEQVYLFGSLAQSGRFRPQSDIDLAIVSTDIRQETPFWRALEQALVRQIDLRPLVAPIDEAVQQHGVLLYERQDKHFNQSDRTRFNGN